MYDEITLPQAAAQIGVGYSVAMRLALSGALGSARQANGRWHIPADGVRAFIAKRDASTSTAV